MSITVTAGKVPGTLVSIRLEGGSVLDVMKTAARECNFEFKTEAYTVGAKTMIDVPYHNGKELCRREGDKIVEIFWDTVVGDGDSVLLVPKITGNQVTVSVAREPGKVFHVAVIGHNEPEARMNSGAGTVADAIRVAGLEVRANEELFLNGKRTRPTQFLRNGDMVTIKMVENRMRETDGETDDDDDDEGNKPTVIYGHFDEQLEVKEFDEGDDLDDFLTENDIDLGNMGEERVVFNGQLLGTGNSPKLEPGDSIVIVQTQSCVAL